jgi:hypothetical protein
VSDRIDFGGDPWQAIPRATLRDPRLGAKAKGGLVTLLSHDEGWVRSAVATLQRECDIGRAQAQSIMRELRDLGYATLITERTLDGRVASHYIVHARPLQPAGSEAQTSESPVAGSSARPVLRPAGNQAAEVEALDVEPQPEEPEAKISSAAPRRRDLAFDALAELEGGAQELTRGARARVGTKLAEIRAVAPDVSPEEIRRRAGNLRLLFPQARATAASLASHWAQCDRIPTANGRRDPAAEIFGRAVSDGFGASAGPGGPAAGVLPGS